jgi:hypothetical protein
MPPRDRYQPRRSAITSRASASSSSVSMVTPPWP